MQRWGAPVTRVASSGLKAALPGVSVYGRMPGQGEGEGEGKLGLALGLGSGLGLGLWLGFRLALG